MGIFLSCSHVSTTVWLQLLDFDGTLGKKARLDIRKDTVYCFKLILEASENSSSMDTYLPSKCSGYYRKS